MTKTTLPVLYARQDNICFVPKCLTPPHIMRAQIATIADYEHCPFEWLELKENTVLSTC